MIPGEFLSATPGNKTLLQRRLSINKIVPWKETSRLSVCVPGQQTSQRSIFLNKNCSWGRKLVTSCLLSRSTILLQKVVFSKRKICIFGRKHLALTIDSHLKKCKNELTSRSLKSVVNLIWNPSLSSRNFALREMVIFH